ncbi:AbrB/MazE/SpoVT family DNA-binding domain-containing protein [Vulcanisaeta sp. JCM 14467]
MNRRIKVNGLPYKTRVYINNQVLIPSELVKLLGIERSLFADVVIKHEGRVISINGVRLLRNRRATSRQFTIPREIREAYGIKPLDEIEIISVEPVEITGRRNAVLNP